MTRFHLTITIYNPFFMGKLDSRGKIDSVWFDDYSYFFGRVLDDLKYSDINKFRLNCFNYFKHFLSFVRVVEFQNGACLEGYKIINQDFNLTIHEIACLIPSRFVRDKYFEYDCLREKYCLKNDFISYLKK